MNKTVGLISTFILFFFFSKSQDIFPKHEMRAAWIATVNNIDWPSKPGLSTKEQKNEFVGILDMHKKLGINAIVMQIRPCADAFYPSELEPWSRYLTGEQGLAPEPFYDPLEFMIEEAHKRCMEFHAWFNPYRVMMNKNKDQLDSNHVAIKYPEWFLDYGNKRYFDPALPETRDFVKKVIADVVSRYDIDAVHFDDYFYPYKIKDVDFPDSISFKNHARGFTAENKDGWRRDNVNLIIKSLRDTIKSIKPYVKFGISPFGIWRNKSSDPLGSETAGSENYDNLYADVRYWLEVGWLDYVAPQLYWHRNRKVASYKVLADWWSKNAFGKHLYIGQGLYRVDPKAKHTAWRDANEIPEQIKINRKNTNILGSVFFTTNSFQKNPLKVNEILKEQFYKYPAIVPPMEYLDSQKPNAPIEIQKEKQYFSWKLKWETAKDSIEANNSRFYIVYRFKKKIDFNDPKYIYTITSEKETLIPRRFFLFRSKAKFYVTALNRLYIESQPGQVFIIRH